MQCNHNLLIVDGRGVYWGMLTVKVLLWMCDNGVQFTLCVHVHYIQMAFPLTNATYPTPLSSLFGLPVLEFLNNQWGLFRNRVRIGLSYRTGPGGIGSS